MAFFQNEPVKPRSELDKVHYKYITESDTKSLLVHLESERKILAEKLVHQEEQIEKTKQQITQKDEQISVIKNEMNSKFKKVPNTDEDPIMILREELTRLGITDDSAKILGAVNSLSEMLKAKKQP